MHHVNTGHTYYGWVTMLIFQLSITGITNSMLSGTFLFIKEIAYSSHQKTVELINEFK